MRKLLPYFLLAPNILLVVGFFAYTVAWNFGLSFFSWDPIKPEQRLFVGLENYETILSDRTFWLSAVNSFAFLIGTVVAQFVLGLVIAVFLNRNFKGKELIITSVLIPFMVAPAVAAFSWKLLMQPNLGLLTYVFNLFSLPRILWYASPETALLSVMIADTWQNTPFVILTLYAGLQAIPSDQFESAKVDGATGWQVFRYITMPWLTTLILIVLMFRTIFAFRAFEIALLLAGSRGGPGLAAMVLGIYLYDRAFYFFQYGMAATVAIILLVVTAAIGVGYFVFLGKKVVL